MFPQKPLFLNLVKHTIASMPPPPPPYFYGASSWTLRHCQHCLVFLMANHRSRLQAGITIDTKDKKPDPPQRPPPMNRPGAPRGENMPPPGRRGPPPPNHKPSRSQEEALRARRQRPNGDGPNSPPRRTGPGSGRGRRNSESSLSERPALTEEERRARDKRRREERKRRENRDKPPRTHRDMDLIDKLDATSIYGTGRKFPTATTSIL